MTENRGGAFCAPLGHTKMKRDRCRAMFVRDPKAGESREPPEHETSPNVEVSAVLVSSPMMVLCLVGPAHEVPISLKLAALPVSNVEEALRPNMIVLCRSRTVRLKSSALQVITTTLAPIAVSVVLLEPIKWSLAKTIALPALEALPLILMDQRT